MFLTLLVFAQSEEGIASYYGDQFDGRKTASGEIYDPNAFTAAHRTLRFGVRLQVINLDNGKWTVVTVNDRGPYVKGRLIDLSKAAAEKLGMIATGTAHVRIIPIPFGEEPQPPKDLPHPVPVSAPAVSGSAPSAPPVVEAPQASSAPPSPGPIAEPRYVQVGAFLVAGNAQIFARLLTGEGFQPRIRADGGMNRVFLIADGDSGLEKLKESLRSQGHRNFLVVHQKPAGTDVPLVTP